MSKLSCKNLNISIANKQVCNDLNLQINEGESWGILGRNGVGKTTLLHTMSGLRQADSGAISINQSSISELSRKQVAQKLGLLLQQNEESFPSTVLETVLCGRHPHIGNWQWENDHDLNIAKQSLKTVNMSEMLNRSTEHLSGGEKQRVAIASLLTQSPDIYLLDEPNSHLDLHYQIQLLTHFSNLSSKQTKCVVMSLHDINLTQRFCSHALFLYGDGKHEQGPINKLLTTEKLSQLYGHPIKKSHDQGDEFFWPA